MNEEDKKIFSKVKNKLLKEVGLSNEPFIFSWSLRRSYAVALLKLKAALLFNSKVTPLHLNRVTPMPSSILDGAFNALRASIDLGNYLNIDVSQYDFSGEKEYRKKCNNFEEFICVSTNDCLKLLFTSSPKDERALAESLLNSFLDQYKVYAYLVLEKYNIDFYGAMMKEIQE